MEHLVVADYMNKRPITFNVDATVPVAVQKFINSNQIGGPVVDPNGHVLGWVSEQDCMRAMIEESYHCEQVDKISDVMRKEVLTLLPDHSIMELAEEMPVTNPKRILLLTKMCWLALSPVTTL